MKECRTVRELLALRPSDWSASERRTVESHLASCGECAALARVYAEQNRVIQATQRVRLTASQRDQLLSRTQRERRRYAMRTTLSTVLGTAAATAALIALGFGLYSLFGGGGQPTVDLSSPTAFAVAPEPPVFGAEIRLDALILNPPAGKPITVTLDTWEPTELSTLSRLYVPADLLLTLNWQVWAPVSADWQVFLQLMNVAGELVLQSDAEVDWPPRPCTGGDAGPECTVTTAHGWALPGDLPPGIYTVVVGLYDRETGERAPVTDPPGVTPPQLALGRLEVLEPLVFAEEIRIDGFTLDPQFEELVPFTLGERDPADPFAPGRLQVPANIRFALDWRVMAPPSADWQVFLHLVDAAGALVAQSDAGVDWPAQPCPEGEVSPVCTVTTAHEWALPADLTPGLYTIVIGLYNPLTGERAPVTKPAGATMGQAILGRVQVRAQE